jgi:hypothetical protein
VKVRALTVFFKKDEPEVETSRHGALKKFLFHLINCEKSGSNSAGANGVCLPCRRHTERCFVPHDSCPWCLHHKECNTEGRCYIRAKRCMIEDCGIDSSVANLLITGAFTVDTAMKILIEKEKEEEEIL